MMKFEATTTFAFQIIALFSIFVACTVSAGAQIGGEAMPMTLSEPLVLEEGDGDPIWLRERHFVQHVNASWFSGEIDDWYGTALLFRVMGPNHAEELIALTPRTMNAIGEQLISTGVASVIVHRFSCDETVLKKGELCDTSAIGMTVLRSPNDTRFPE